MSAEGGNRTYHLRARDTMSKRKSKERNNETKTLFSKWWFWVILSVVFLLLIHVAFSIDAPTKFLEAKWSAGELISFAGTMVLGAVAIGQTQKSNRIAERAMRVSERLMERELADTLPMIDIRPLSRIAAKQYPFEKTLRASAHECYCWINDDYEIQEAEGDVLFFGIKNVCNHDILDIMLTKVEVDSPNKNRCFYSCDVSIYDSALSAGESTALILTIPQKHFIQVAAYNEKVKSDIEMKDLALTLQFHLTNNDGITYAEKVEVHVVDAEQPMFFRPVMSSKHVNIPFKLN